MKTNILTAFLMLSLSSLAFSQTKQTKDGKTDRPTTTVKDTENTKPVTGKTDDKEVLPVKETARNKPKPAPAPVQNTEVHAKPSIGNETTGRTNGGYEEVIQDINGKGSVNWTVNQIEAVGVGFIDRASFPDPGQAEYMARRHAIADAQRNLLETVDGVAVVGEYGVRQMKQYDYVRTRVDGLLRGAQMVGDPIIIGDQMEVRYRVALYGENGLSSAFRPQEIKQALAKKYGDRNVKSGNRQQGEIPTIDGKPLMFTVNGKSFDPTMFPIIVDEEDGKVFFDFSELVSDGSVPKFLQATKELLNDTGFKEGAKVVELISNGKGEFTLPKEIRNQVRWKRATEIGKGIIDFLFGIFL